MSLEDEFVIEGSLKIAGNDVWVVGRYIEVVGWFSEKWANNSGRNEKN